MVEIYDELIGTVGAARGRTAAPTREEATRRVREVPVSMAGLIEKLRKGGSLEFVVVEEAKRGL